MTAMELSCPYCRPDVAEYFDSLLERPAPLSTVYIKPSKNIRGVEPKVWKIYGEDTVDTVKQWFSNKLWHKDSLYVRRSSMWMEMHRKFDDVCVGQLAHNKRLAAHLTEFRDHYLVLHCTSGAQMGDQCFNGTYQVHNKKQKVMETCDDQLPEQQRAASSSMVVEVNLYHQRLA